HGIAGLPLESTAIVRFRGCPIQVGTLFDVHQRVVRLRDRLIQLESLQGSWLRLWVDIAGRTGSEDAHRAVRVGEAGITVGGSGIDFNRRGEEFNALCQALLSPFVSEKCSLKIRLISLVVHMTRSCEAVALIG